MSSASRSPSHSERFITATKQARASSADPPGSPTTDADALACFSDPDRYDLAVWPHSRAGVETTAAGWHVANGDSSHQRNHSNDSGFCPAGHAISFRQTVTAA